MKYVGSPGGPRLQPADDALWRNVPDGVVILPPGAVDPVLLAGTGGELWAHLGPGTTLERLVEQLSEAHGADPATVRTDVEAALARLVDLRAVTSQAC